MVAFFPDPVKEQLLADVFGRYGILGGFRTQYGINRDLFGRETSRISLDFPTALEELISRLPPGHQYTADGLIDDHTILPYYAPFIPPSRLKKIRMAMKTNTGRAISPKLGIPTFKVQRPTFLRFCPVCAAEERDRKFCIFHRVHQIEGVEVCPEHGVLLMSTSIATKAQRWVCAETVISDIPEPEYIDLTTYEGALLVAIAKDSRWLLDHPNVSIGPTEILRRYRAILANRGWANAIGAPAQKKIRELIRSLYPANLLERLGCPLKDNDDWVHKVLGHNTVLPPLYHILFIRFLEIKLEEFFFQDWQLKPFGDGPWSCFNPVTHLHKYAAETVKNVTIKVEFDERRQMNRIVGVFSCECGFSYSLYGNTERTQRAPHSRNILTRGEEWDNALKEAWNDTQLGNSDVRYRFRLRWKDLLGEAKRLNLAIPRIGKRRRYSQAKKRKSSVPLPPISDRAFSEKRRQMETEWLELRKDYPTHNTSKLRTINRRLYNWLQKHHKQWFDENKPPRVSKAPNWTKEDLQQVDTEISSQLPGAAIAVKNKIGLPQRVTPHAMFAILSKDDFVKRQKANLPITFTTAQQLAETDEDWEARRRSYYQQKQK